MNKAGCKTACMLALGACLAAAPAPMTALCEQVDGSGVTDVTVQMTAPAPKPDDGNVEQVIDVGKQQPDGWKPVEGDDGKPVLAPVVNKEYATGSRKSEATAVEGIAAASTTASGSRVTTVTTVTETSGKTAGDEAHVTAFRTGAAVSGLAALAMLTGAGAILASRRRKEEKKDTTEATAEGLAKAGA